MKIGRHHPTTTNASLLYHGVFAPRSPVSKGNQEKEVLIDTKWSGWSANNGKYLKEILPKYRRVRDKPKWNKNLWRKDGRKSRHVAWAQLLWRSFGVMGVGDTNDGFFKSLHS
jgi:hypothetical protein